jgi:hypothetical protein
LAGFGKADSGCGEQSRFVFSNGKFDDGATMLIVGNLWADLRLKAVAPRSELEDLK